MTIAELKRKLQPGTHVTMTWHRYAATWRNGDERIALLNGGLTREVIRHQGKCVRVPHADWWGVIP